MKQRIARAGVAVLLVGGVTVALSVPSQAGISARTNISKLVIGTPPDPAATFTVNYLCAGTQAVNQNLVFNATGAPSPQPTNPINGGFVGTCTITETGTAGAVHVTYACAVAAPPQQNATCSGGGASPVVITFTAPGANAGVIANVTVTNDFTPDPAVAVVSGPNFTG